MKHHAEPLAPASWPSHKERILAARAHDVFPCGREKRLARRCRAPAQARA